MIAHLKIWLLTAAVAAICAIALGCSTSAAPTECLDAARDAGLPDAMLEHIQNPGDMNALQRIALRKALEAAGLDSICGQFN